MESVEESLKKIDQMSGQEFEEYCAKLLRFNGYTDVEVTKNSGDYGIDIIAKKYGINYGFQCKRYNETIGIKALQEAYSGARYYKLHRAVVITNSYFSPNAKEFAQKVDVELYDREKLKKLIKNFNEDMYAMSTMKDYEFYGYYKKKYNNDSIYDYQRRHEEMYKRNMEMETGKWALIIMGIMFIISMIAMAKIY